MTYNNQGNELQMMVGNELKMMVMMCITDTIMAMRNELEYSTMVATVGDRQMKQ